MSVESLCQICEAARARHRCDRCGAFVCDDHYHAETGMCTDCAAGAGGERRGQG